MKELIIWYYQLPIVHLKRLNDIYYTQLENQYIYIIPVGKDKNTVFFHLLQLLRYNKDQQVLLSKENTTTVLYEGKHYYVLQSATLLHDYIDIATLQLPILYAEGFPVARHLKERWLNKNRLYEEQLNITTLDLELYNRLLFFDLATYYIHLNEQAYTFINQLVNESYAISLCHARLTPKTYTYECFAPELLILDNKSRCYSEYLRHLYLETGDLKQIHAAIHMINRINPLTKEEWELLYTRHYFPTHFYDILYQIRNDEPVKLTTLYEQTLNYSKLLYQVPYEVYHSTGIALHVPEWVKNEVFNPLV